MLFINMIAAMLLWLNACSGFVEPPIVDPPDTLAVEPPGNHTPELRPETIYYYITPVNYPIANEPAQYGVLIGMVDPDGDPMTAVLDTAPLHGVVDLRSDGSWVYTPDPGYTGGDQFWFAAADPWRKSESIMVGILVNTQPLARPDTFSVQAGDSLVITPAALLANDVDVNGHIIFPILADLPAHGQLIDDPETPAQLLYIPEPGFTGTDVFHYYAEESDGSGAASNTTTVTITVHP